MNREEKEKILKNQTHGFKYKCYISICCENAIKEIGIIYLLDFDKLLVDVAGFRKCSQSNCW